MTSKPQKWDPETSWWMDSKSFRRCDTVHGDSLLSQPAWSFQNTCHHTLLLWLEASETRAATLRISWLVGPVPSAQPKERDLKIPRRGKTNLPFLLPKRGCLTSPCPALANCPTAFLKWKNTLSPPRWVFQTHPLTIICSWSYLHTLLLQPILNFRKLLLIESTMFSPNPPRLLFTYFLLRLHPIIYHFDALLSPVFSVGPSSQTYSGWVQRSAFWMPAKKAAEAQLHHKCVTPLLNGPEQ